MSTLVLLPSVLAAVLSPVAQYSDRTEPVSVVRADSQAIVKSLRSDQRRFEWVRRQHLPRVLGARSGRCDVVVGRFCYWDDDDESTWTPKTEHHRVVRERRTLLDRLDSAAAVLPGDPWIAGQRIRYLIETARFQDALWAVRECRAATWWCHALEGFVLHNMGDHGTADSAFALALDAMSNERRCDWNDLSKLLEGEDAGVYRDAGCTTRDSLNTHVWWLADPLFLVAGNERRTEHYARLVLDQLLDGTAIVYGSKWGRDNRELVVRYGWSIAWEREPSRGFDPRPRIIGHHMDGGKRFLPPFEYVTQPARIVRDEWDIDPTVPRTRAAARYASQFRALDHQLALFRRGDSVAVVVGYDLWETPDDDLRPETDRGETIEAGLFLDRDPASRRVARHTTRTGSGALAVRAPAFPMLLSVEALHRGDSLAARSRYWVNLADRFSQPFAVSDILLLSDTPSLPTSLDEVISRARPSTRFEPGEPIEIYWEVYGPPGNTVHEVSLSVSKRGGGLFRRAVEWMGLAGERRPETFRWEGPTSVSPDGAGRSIGIRLAEEDEGRYLLRLEIRADTGQTAVTEREIQVRRR